MTLTVAAMPLKPATAGNWHNNGGHGGWYGGGFTFGIYGAPGYYYVPPPPVYYAPPPVYYAPPVYYQPAPAYYAPPSLGFSFSFPIGGHYGYYGH